MGYECGFSKIKRFKDCSFEEMLEAREKVYFLKNNWLTDSYSSYEEYARSNSWNKDKELLPISDEMVEFYKNLEDDPTIEFWCSIGQRFKDDIKDFCKSGDMDFEIENYEGLQNWINEEIRLRQFIPIEIQYGIKKNDDESMNLFRIDGLQIVDEDGNTKQIELSDLWESGLYITRNMCDTDEVYAFDRLRDVINEIQDIDKNEYFVWFWESY